MTPEQLKASILQYAIQGKLVEQRPEEGTGEELYQQIQAEKQQLIKEGRIKKEKPLAEIADDEIPFDIPESWKWVRLGDLANINGGFAFKSTNYTSEGVRVIRISDFNERGFVNDKIVRYPYDDSLSQYVLDLKNILLCMTGGTVGKSLFITELDEKMVVNQRVATIKVNSVMPEYVYQAILAPITQKVIQDSKNSTNDNISMDTIKDFLIPLPPLAEQKRIVAKIEELLPYVDRYADAYEKLEQFNAKFPEDMKKSILQYAIQGKLVEQKPEEGTGEELYRQIQAEKHRLSKEGRIKKEKPLAEITEDELPFDIPESWKWYRIGELFNIVNGFTPLKSNPEFWTDGDIPWFTIEDVRRQGRFISSTEKFITRKALAKNTERIVPADTVLLCCTASVGEYAYAKIPLTTNQQFNAFVVKDYYKNAVYPLYVFEYAKTLKGSLIDRAGKTTFNFVSVGKLSNMLIPLPPLAEQKRIVAKLEELLPLCERLK